MTTRLRSLVLLVALATGSVAGIVASAPAAQATTGERPGSVTEYPISGGAGLGGLTTGPDGNLWWADGVNINRMSPSGPPIAQFPAAGSNGITVGPDGNLWFTLGTDIGRITTSGAITTFPAPVGRSPGVQSITTGPDGNLWLLYQRGVHNPDFGFNEPNVAKMDTSGNATGYSLNTESLATQITAGPDGRIWWVNRNGATLEAFDPADPVGTFTKYASGGSGGADGGLYSLTAGPDGNVWYSKASCCSAIGRITPSGSTRLFPVPTEGPTAVALGPDGNIWFNGRSGRDLGLSRISPDGTVKFFGIGRSGFGFQGPGQAMTAGPDGAMWYITGDNIIGRIALGDAQTAVVNLASGFSSNHIRTPGPGTNVKFVFAGPTSATATDTTAGMNLFDSGAKSFVTNFSYNYFAAGSYTYVDVLHPGHTGTVDVPPTASARYAYAGGVGGAAYTVEWASQAPPAGFEYDVQRQDPGGAFADYIMATTDTNSFERPYLPAGPYSYRARLHRISDDAVSDWSPPVLVRYGVGAPAAFGGNGTQRAVFRPDSGAWFQDDGGPTTNFFGLPGDLPVPLDFNGDGVTDRAVYRPDVGAWYYDDGGPTTSYFGLPGDTPAPGDYNGDGIDDRAIFRPDIGAWYIDDGGPTIKFFGASGDVPVPGDYDGDGKTDEAVYRPSTGQWFVFRSSDSAVVTTNFGLSGDVPVPGDYDGDGKGDQAIFRPSSGSWFIHPSSGGPDTALNYGLSVDIPVPGDYNADGVTDIAVYRRTSGAQWYIHPTGGGPDTVSNFGFAGDIPLPLPAAIEQTYFP